MRVTNQKQQVEIQYSDSFASATDNGQDVIAGLTSQAKTLPPKYFYD